MVTRTSQVLTALPPRWVWTALTDVDNLDRWSGLQDCVDHDERRLHAGSSWDCRMHLAEHTLATTVTVIEARAPSRLVLRSETPLLTVVETLAVSPASNGASVAWDVRAHSRLAWPMLQQWLDAHAALVDHGLRRLLLAPTPHAT